MRLLLDTNVVLDVLLNRSPWVTEASEIWQANDDGRIIGYITASAITDIFYIARRLTSLEIAHTAVLTCLEAFQICTVDRRVLEEAISLPGSKDFEDNIQLACANIEGLEAIVTRDPDGFNMATLLVLTPTEAAAQIRNSK